MSNDFEQRTKALFDKSVDELDENARSRLARARAAALDAAEPVTATRPWRVWAPAAGLTVAAIGAVAVVMKTREPDAPTAIEELELLASADPDMVENFEFYAWIEQQPEWQG